MLPLNDVIDEKLLHGIPQQPQVQCSTFDQLRAVHALAIRFGLYDAADAIRRHYILDESPASRG